MLSLYYKRVCSRFH